jgi:hypothetical protein
VRLAVAENEFVIVPPADADVSKMPLLADMQFLDPYGSESINRKFYGIIPEGIYRGFKCALLGGMGLAVGVPNDPGTAVVATGGVCVTVQQRSPIHIQVPAGFSGYVVLTANYQFGVPTKQVHTKSLIDAAKIELVSVAARQPNQIIICSLNVPGDAVELTLPMVSDEKRQDVSIAVSSNIFNELTKHITSPTAHTKDQVGLSHLNNWPASASISNPSDQEYATSGAVNRVRELASQPFTPTTSVTVGGTGGVYYPVVLETALNHISVRRHTHSDNSQWSGALSLDLVSCQSDGWGGSAAMMDGMWSSGFNTVGLGGDAGKPLFGKMTANTNDPAVVVWLLGGGRTYQISGVSRVYELKSPYHLADEARTFAPITTAELPATSSTLLRVNPVTNIATAAGINISGVGVGEGLSIGGKTAVGGSNDSWIRLNPHSQFADGVYTGTQGLFRHDGVAFSLGDFGVSPSTMLCRASDEGWSNLNGGRAALSVRVDDSASAHWVFGSYRNANALRSGLQILSNEAGLMRFFTNGLAKYVDIGDGNAFAGAPQSSAPNAYTRKDYLDAVAIAKVDAVTRMFWANNGNAKDCVIGQMGWSKYGNGHTIFDASAGLSPDGTAINNTNPDINWEPACPTLMGWNGGQTYGVRVDSARRADTATSAPNYLPLSGGVITRDVGSRPDYDSSQLMINGVGGACAASIGFHRPNGGAHSIQLRDDFTGISIIAQGGGLGQLRTGGLTADSVVDSGHRVYSPVNKPAPADLGAAATSHRHDWGNLDNVPAGLGTYGAQIANVETDLRIQSGFYNAAPATINKMPFGGDQWQYLFNATHGNVAGYNGVIGVGFDGSVIGFTSVLGGTLQSWKEIWHSGSPRIQAQSAGTPMFELHIPGKIAKAMHLGADNAIHWSRTNGAGAEVSKLASLRDGSLEVNGALWAANNSHGWGEQYATLAPFHVDFGAVPGSSDYYPIVRGKNAVVGQGYTTQVELGIFREGVKWGDAILMVSSGEGNGEGSPSAKYRFDWAGNFYAPGGVHEFGERVYSPKNKPTPDAIGAMRDGGAYSTVTMNNWFRSAGETGWYSAAFGGGIHMQDAEWLRVFGGKKFFVANSSHDAINTGGGVFAVGVINAQGGVTDTGQRVYSPINKPSPDAIGALNKRARMNWVDGGVLEAVIGQLVWSKFGNGHTIFDASAGLSPDGTAIDTRDPKEAWAPTHPTLMGWNGGSTYGVRVDSARYADSATSAPNYLPLSGGAITRAVGSRPDYTSGQLEIRAGDGGAACIGFHRPGAFAHSIQLRDDFNGISIIAQGGGLGQLRTSGLTADAVVDSGHRVFSPVNPPNSSHVGLGNVENKKWVLRGSGSCSFGLTNGRRDYRGRIDTGVPADSRIFDPNRYRVVLKTMGSISTSGDPSGVWWHVTGEVMPVTYWSQTPKLFIEVYTSGGGIGGGVVDVWELWEWA